MLPGFEEQTCNLSAAEMGLVAGFVTSFRKRIGPENAVTSEEIIKRYEAAGKKMSGARVRKIISYIRDEGLLPGLVASSKGYYITRDPAEVQRWIMSLEGRETKIRMIRKKAEDYLYSLRNHGQVKLNL